MYKKECTSCNRIKSFDYFAKDRKTKVLRTVCKQCVAHSTTKEWRKNNPERKKQLDKKWKAANKESVKNQHLKSKYGISIEEYNKMLIAQEFCCSICESSFSSFKAAPAVDHCHKSGAVRELLCSNCNSLLGFAKENEYTLQKALEYIGRHKKLNKESE